MKIKISWFACILLLFCGIAAHAQSDSQKYREVISKRATKILDPLGIADSVTYKRVHGLLVNQYADLNTHHEQRDSDMKELKTKYAGQDARLEKQRKSYEKRADKKLRKLHKGFIHALQDIVTAEQLDGIKNGMTYGVLPVTYRAYQDMIPSLTDAQKEKILITLTEAREFAMDEPGSKQKHAVFGKYKGRINNYLSAEGYDLQRERSKWEQRQAEAKGAK